MPRQIANRTIFTGDNLDILRGFNSATVDLVYLDPPFNSNRNYAAPAGSAAAGAAFKDTWTLDDTDEAWLGQIADAHPGLYSVIHAMGAVGRRGDKAYLIYMAVRLLEIRRVVKSTASIYLHCDPTMSHPLKMVMDAVFGNSGPNHKRPGFRNEIVWCYSGGGIPKYDFPRKHDTILRYVKGTDCVFHVERKPYAENTQQVGIHSTLAAPDNAINLERGTPVTDWWTDIRTATGWSVERTGYPTQKPLPLLERIICASSDEGDVVLDPFCGCATTCVAAEKHKRQWIGIDISRKAVDLARQRMQHDSNYPALFAKKVTARGDIPKRTDAGAVKPPRNIKHVLFGRQQGLCKGCKHDFPFRNFTIDHRIPLSLGGQDIEENLQLLCNYCNSRKGAGTMEELLAKLKKELPS
ncbi:MAG: DNA methyltransferase [Gammaproteobacteria bacterium]|nr:DNA methyltransferase [Gammaproteobacteria bacterium]